MRDDFHLSDGLLDKIMLKIATERSRQARFRLISFSLISLTVLLGIIPIWREFYAEITQSGFSQIFPLLFSDSIIIIFNWQDFVISLAESFPVFISSVMLISVFVFLLSMQFIVRDTISLKS